MLKKCYVNDYLVSLYEELVFLCQRFYGVLIIDSSVYKLDMFIQHTYIY